MSISNPIVKVMIKKGFKAFEKEDFEAAMRYFSAALMIEPFSLPGKIGVLLSDIALDLPLEAMRFYELYQDMLASTPRRIHKQIHRMVLRDIQNFDSGLSYVNEMILQDRDRLDELDGILYKDFKQSAASIGFKRAYESLLFSTQIIFTHKDDFYDFLEKLVDHGLSSHCTKYIDAMNEKYIRDARMIKIIDKIAKK